MRIKRKIARLRIAILLLVSVALTSYATLNESLSLALEIATPDVEEGFDVREDFWTGEIPSGESKLIRHQLFRGNEYWFWLAAVDSSSVVKVEIFDNEGESAELETVSGKNHSKVRVLPKKTGVYYIRISVESKKLEEVHWALAYGYR